MAQTINHSKTLKSFCKGCGLTFSAVLIRIQQQQSLTDLLNNPIGLERFGEGFEGKGRPDILTFLPQQLKSQLTPLLVNLEKGHRA